MGTVPRRRASCGTVALVSSLHGRDAAATAPTLDEVAQAAGVSRSTASRVITGDPRVSERARTAVQGAVARLGYVPNRAARTLATRRTGSVALVVAEPDSQVLSDPFLVGVVRGVSLATEPTDLQVVLLLEPRDGATDRIARYLAGGHVDGAVVASHHVDDGIDEVTRRVGLPTVFIGRPSDELPDDLAYVDVENVRSAHEATRRLVAAGCRRIGHVTGRLDMTAGTDRLAGWRAALQEAGLPDDAWEPTDFTVRAGELAAARLLERFPDLDGVFAASDLLAQGVYQALERAGRHVPDDVSVVGFDDLGVAESLRPSLTTVRNPVEALARRATEILLDRIAGRATPGGDRWIVEGTVVDRDSVRHRRRG